uniref:Transmembrane protein 216 n=1 Tax=Paramormyrops kingsleyae TaxID=1676925 RepID=A0A3B3R2A0_9TELE
MSEWGKHKLNHMCHCILLQLNGWYFAAYFLAEILIFVYKGILLPYPPANLILDIVLLFLFLGLETLRIFYGQKGNLCQQSLSLVVSMGVLVPCAVLSVYYLLLQTFVLRLEVTLNAVLLCFHSLELLLGLVTVSAFSRYTLLRKASNSRNGIELQHVVINPPPPHVLQKPRVAVKGGERSNKCCDVCIL